MTEKQEPDYAADWTAYWAGGLLTSLPADFDDIYDGEIGEFWHQRCAALGQRARIADLCSGNGAIALLVAQWAERHSRDWIIEAVDAAELNPQRLAAVWPQYRELIGKISWHGQQRVEDFPLVNDGYDLLTSQYGLEYCDWRAGAMKAAELLKPGGRLAMINHAPDSRMMAVMHSEQRDYQSLDHSGAVDSVRARLSTSSAGLKALDAKLARSEHLLRQALGGRESALLEDMLNTLVALRHAHQKDIDIGRQQLSAWLDQLNAARGRLDNMLSVNDAIFARPDWIEIFTGAGLQLELDEPVVYAGQHAVGRARVLVKP